MSTPQETKETPVAPAEELKSIFMYRMWDRQKIRWKFEVDKDMVIIREGPVDPNFSSNLPVGMMGRPPIPAHIPIKERLGPAEIAAQQAKHAAESLERHKKSLDARGIKYKHLENGSILIEEIPTKEKQIMQFFDLKQACPDISGMQTIRDAYKTEHTSLGGNACPSCQLNGLMRKYRNILETSVFAK